MHTVRVIHNHVTSIPEKFTNDLYKQFINYLDVKPKTIETYTKALRQLFLYFSIQGIYQPQREDIINFRQWLIESHKKPTTIQNYIVVTRLFFQWLSQENIYPNIAQHIKGAKIDRSHKKDYLINTQVKEILQNMDHNTIQGIRNYAILTLMITGGLRTIEVVRADIQDIRTLGNETVLYIQGKGQEEKTEYVKLSPKVEKAMRAYLKQRENAKGNNPLFVSHSNNSTHNRLTTRTISSIVKTQLKQAGYDSARLTAHSLRHTAVTLSILAGNDITEVQQFARHANISTTMIYNHALDKEKNNCAQSIANAIF